MAQRESQGELDEVDGINDIDDMNAKEKTEAAEAERIISPNASEAGL